MQPGVKVVKARSNAKANRRERMETTPATLAAVASIAKEGFAKATLSRTSCSVVVRQVGR